ncbi:uncharacterized protein LOC124277269 [Haliotis rubra]|uniref:uncharacterized protein LOC124277269 n=1 Tax=Haliotis rubra TaxID=36100 RepID=UPI001EE5245D|nr:uncharacterized protein LOC124277269 [Haliotis rubra]
MASIAEKQGGKTQDVNLNFDKLNVRELKTYLRNHGEHVSGNKSDLILRAKGVRDLGKRSIEDVNTYDVVSVRQRRFEKFLSPLGELLPDPLRLKNGWDSRVELMPSFSSSDLYNYLVLSKQRTLDTDPNNAKRQLKAKVYYEDRHVHSVRYHHISADCSHCYVNAKVIPSIPTQNMKQKPDYDVWVSLSKVTGRVHAAGCNCTAGEGESCNHVAAVLYALVDISEKKLEGLHASTSQECKWNQPRKRKLSPVKSQDMTFTKHKWIEHKKTTTIRQDATNAPDKSMVKPINVDRFAPKLCEHFPHAGWLLTQESVVNMTEESHVSVPPLHSVDFNYADTCDLKNEDCIRYFSEYFSALSISKEDCVTIEKNTRGQANNNMTFLILDPVLMVLFTLEMKLDFLKLSVLTSGGFPQYNRQREILNSVLRSRKEKLN